MVVSHEMTSDMVAVVGYNIVPLWILGAIHNNALVAYLYPYS